MRLLITGATGFVGRNLLLQVLKNQQYSKIILPVRSPEKLARLFQEDGVADSRIEVIQSEAPTWQGLEGIQVDQVIHGAGVLFEDQWEKYYSTNVVGTVHLIEQLPDVPVVILSSIAAAGPCESGEEAKAEASQERPVTLYGRSKLEMERQVKERFPNRKLLFLRPPMIFGARDTATLPLFKMARGPVQFKPGFKKKAYSFISVDDLIRGILACLGHSDVWSKLPQQHFFISADQIIDDETMIRSASEASRRPSRIVRIPQPIIKMASRVIDSVPSWRKSVPTLTVDRAKEIWPDRWVASSRAFASSFDWKATDEFSHVVQETYDWYVKSGQIEA